jgi:hypothetical protein
LVAAVLVGRSYDLLGGHAALLTANRISSIKTRGRPLVGEQALDEPAKKTTQRFR